MDAYAIEITLSAKDAATKQIGDVERKVNELVSSLSRAGSGVDRFNVSTRKIAEEASRSGAALASMTGYVRSLIGVIGGATAIYSLGRGLQYATEAAANLEQSIGKFNQVFKGMEAQAYAWASGLQKSFGMSRQSSQDTMSDFAHLHKAMGMTSQGAGALSVKWVSLAADMGAFNNLPTTQVLEAIRSAVVGEYDPLQRMGVAITAATVETKALSMGLADTKDELSMADKAMAVYQITLEQSGDLIGQFAREHDNLATQQQIAGELVDDLAARIGTNLAPAVAQHLSQINEWIGEQMRLQDSGLPNYIDSISNALTNLIGISSGVIAALGKIASAAASAAQMIASVHGIEDHMDPEDPRKGGGPSPIEKAQMRGYENSIRAEQDKIRQWQEDTQGWRGRLFGDDVYKDQIVESENKIRNLTTSLNGLKESSGLAAQEQERHNKLMHAGKADVEGLAGAESDMTSADEALGEEKRRLQTKINSNVEGHRKNSGAKSAAAKASRELEQQVRKENDANERAIPIADRIRAAEDALAYAQKNNTNGVALAKEKLKKLQEESKRAAEAEQKAMRESILASNDYAAGVKLANEEAAKENTEAKRGYEERKRLIQDQKRALEDYIPGQQKVLAAESAYQNALASGNPVGLRKAEIMRNSAAVAWELTVATEKQTKAQKEYNAALASGDPGAIALATKNLAAAQDDVTAALERQEDQIRENIMASNDFGAGMKLAFRDAIREQETWAERSYTLFGDFVDGAKSTVGENLYDIFTGDFDKIADAWASFGESLLRAFSDMAADAIVDWGMEKLGGLIFGKDGSLTMTADQAIPANTSATQQNTRAIESLTGAIGGGFSAGGGGYSFGSIGAGVVTPRSGNYGMGSDAASLAAAEAGYSAAGGGVVSGLGAITKQEWLGALGSAVNLYGAIKSGSGASAAFAGADTAAKAWELAAKAGYVPAMPGSIGAGVGVASGAYGLYGSIKNKDYLGAAFNAYNLYSSGSALYGAFTAAPAATTAATTATTAATTAATTGAATTGVSGAGLGGLSATMAGWGSIAGIALGAGLAALSSREKDKIQKKAKEEMEKIDQFRIDAIAHGDMAAAAAYHDQIKQIQKQVFAGEHGISSLQGVMMYNQDDEAPKMKGWKDAGGGKMIMEMETALKKSYGDAIDNIEFAHIQVMLENELEKVRKGMSSSALIEFSAAFGEIDTASFEQKMSALGMIGTGTGWTSKATLEMITALGKGDVPWSDIESFLTRSGVTDAEVLKTIKAAYDEGNTGMRSIDQWAEKMRMIGVDDQTIKTILGSYSGTDVLGNWPAMENAMKTLGIDTVTQKRIAGAYSSDGMFKDWAALNEAMQRDGRPVDINKRIYGSYHGDRVFNDWKSVEHAMRASGVDDNTIKWIRGQYNGNISYDELVNLLTGKGVSQSVVRNIGVQIGADRRQFNDFKMGYDGPTSLKINDNGRALGGPLFYASGGWLANHPAGGFINEGSGVMDDVFLGHSYYGMAREYVVNQQATKKNKHWLDWMNFNGGNIDDLLIRRNFASGGYTGNNGGYRSAVTSPSAHVAGDRRPININIEMDPLEGKIRRIAHEQANDLDIKVSINPALRGRRVPYAAAR